MATRLPIRANRVRVCRGIRRTWSNQREGQLEEAEELGQPLARKRVFPRLRLGDALSQHGHDRVDLPPAAPFQDDLEHLPDVGERLEMVPAIAEHVNDAHHSPGLKLAESHAHVGPGHGQRLADLLGVPGALGDEEQGVDLGHRAVDPHRAPISPQ